jgi:O-methyltransferase involved in polyketide biosynthesis
METITRRWRDNGFDLELGDLGYPGERNDVVTYLDDRSWRSVRTPLRELLAEAGLPIPDSDGGVSVGDNYYCTSTKIAE